MSPVQTYAQSRSSITSGDTLYRIAITMAIGLAAILAPTPANAAPLDDCLAQPGRVAATAVTDQNDAVCLGPDDERVASEGDDTYFWVEGDTNGLYPQGFTPGDPSSEIDPGYDTLSLSDWSTAYVDPANGMFGVSVWFVPDAVTYTDFDDVVGNPNACGSLTSSNDMEFRTGLGADTVQCMTGNIFTQGDDDTIIGVTLDSTANGGGGDDLVTGDAGADEIVLGPGDDIARVRNGGVDLVRGGAGFDTVRASKNDRMRNIERERLPRRH